MAGLPSLSQVLYVNFSPTVWITFPCRVMTSSVSVMSSPIFTMPSEPQQEHAAGASITTRSGGRWSGNGLRAGRRRSNPATAVVFAFPAAISSSVAAASKFLELQLHLVDEAGAAFGAMAIVVASELGDLQLEVLDHGLRGGDHRPGLRQLALRDLGTGLRCRESGAQSGNLGGGIGHAQSIP